VHERRLLDMTGYQWTVLFAAWLGWGFDVFDGLLFNFVAPTCVPTLLGIPHGTPAAREATLYWTGLLSSVLLVGWAVGGILFGRITDRLGRTRTLLLTMAIYSIGTAACAFAPNIWGYRARIRNHGHSCFLCEIVIRSQFHTTYEPEHKV
jgi:Arabinose efflux permease